MSQVDIKHVNELMERAKELERTLNEIREKIESSELSKSVEKLAEIRETLSYFIVRSAPQFGLYFYVPASDEVGILVKRFGFEHVIYVPRDASIIDVYKRFFDDQTALEKLISELVKAMIDVAEAVEKSVDIIQKLRELEGSVKYIINELDAIYKKLEDP